MDSLSENKRPFLGEKNEREQVLESPYDAITVDTLPTKNVVEFLLREAQRNANAGLCQWLVSSLCIYLPIFFSNQLRLVSNSI
jgi:hypothetical protein